MEVTEIVVRTFDLEPKYVLPPYLNKINQKLLPIEWTYENKTDGRRDIFALYRKVILNRSVGLSQFLLSVA